MSVTSVTSDSPAVTLVRAHMAAWANHDLDTARGNVADDVQFFGNDHSTVGIQAYMDGLAQFTEQFVPGSLHIIATWGDERRAMIAAEVTVGGQPFPSARTLELDENGKIKVERVIFFQPPSA
jgi:SnoaL-like domain